MSILFFLIYLIFTLIVLYRAMNPLVWELGSVFYLIVATFAIGLPWIIGFILWFFIVIALLVVYIEPVRTKIADFLYKHAEKSIPHISKTEEDALNAGDTWVEEDIFRGEPNWERLAQITTELTVEEEQFLNHETQILCSMINEWEISQKRDLPETVWNYIKTNGFFGLVIPKEFGGKGFSARAHSEIVQKIATRSGVTAVTVMVPNSLGPGELINYYGTKEQKNYYLPRLAKGIEIPCFALTEPEAGSDATSIQSVAIVVEKKIGGKTVLGLKITFDKRWITLAPIATLIGLAVNVQDPEELLQGVGVEGITCLLVPRDTKNLIIGNRHIPAEQPFMNGTVRGKDIFVPVTAVIGGQQGIGSGWHMLVECLSIGRSISLPAMGAGSSAVSYIASGAFARIRRQFNVEIAQFEGIEEKLAQIAGLTYLIASTRLLTVAALSQAKKPSVASAITKYFNTELARIVINDALDIHAGRGVVVGPRNYLTNLYLGIPISITVEGANVMSRNLLIFGQGSMACHPYIRDEFYAVANKDKAAFRVVIWKHIQYFMQNFAKAICSAWTGGLFVAVPNSSMKKEYKRLTRLSHAFAWLADVSLIYLGGDLKRKERLSARLADGMSYLYLAMAALKSVEMNKDHPDEQLHAQWAVTYCFYQAQKSMRALCSNFPSKMLGFIMQLVAFPFGQTMPYPPDKLGKALAKLMITNNQFRNRLKGFIYLSGDPKQPLDRMEHALQLIIQNDPIFKKVSDLKKVKFGHLRSKLQEKIDKNELTQQEMDDLLCVEAARWDAILVDEFTFDSMKKGTFNSVIDEIESPF
jgi:acyl-CoA dehydrogenase